MDLHPKPLPIMLPSQIIGLPKWCSDEESACSAGDIGSIPGVGRSLEEEILQYSCLENSMDRGVWPATVHGVTKSDTIKQAQTPSKNGSPILLLDQDRNLGLIFDCFPFFTSHTKYVIKLVASTYKLYPNFAHF